MKCKYVIYTEERFVVEDKKRINIALTLELHKKVKLATVEHDTTITDFVVEAIAEKLEREENKGE